MTTIDSSLLPYFIATKYSRNPSRVSVDHRMWARANGYRAICDIIAGPNGRLKERAIEAAREFGFVVPVGMRG